MKEQSWSLTGVKRSSVRLKWKLPLSYSSVWPLNSLFPKGKPLQKSPFLQLVLQCCCGSAWGRGEGGNVFGGCFCQSWLHTLYTGLLPLPRKCLESGTFHLLKKFCVLSMKSAWICSGWEWSGWWRDILGQSEWWDFMFYTVRRRMRWLIKIGKCV